MRKPIAAAAALLVAATACAASGAGSNAKPQLRLVRGSIHGSHFASGELVRISFVGPAPRAQRRVRSTALGTFTATIAAHDPCLGPVLIVARGATGDSARMKLPQRACPPA